VTFEQLKLRTSIFHRQNVIFLYKLTMASSNSNSNDNTTDTMLAFVIENAGDKEGKVVRMPKPTIAGDGAAGADGSDTGSVALIKVLRAGVCNTDLEILQGYMGFTGVLGHEFVGIVEEVKGSNNLDQDWVGKRVCGDINVACCDSGKCRVCRDADQNQFIKCCCPNMARNHCPNRTVLGILKRDGCMAEYITLPVRNLHVVPDHVSDSVAVFAEPLAAACRIPEQGLIAQGDKVAILGDGKLGLMIAEVVGRLYQDHCLVDSDAEGLRRPILFGKHPHKLDLVKDSGVDTRLVSECKEVEADGGGANETYAGTFDVVIDATGSPAGLSLAAGLCRPMGTLCLKSTCAAGEVFQAAPIVIHELRVIGSRCGPIDKALELLGMTHTATKNSNENGGGSSTKKPLGVEKYITKTFPLAQAGDAIKCAAEKSTMKVQIICSER
jgi:threonine dehydrogenase-like Zn-dependent dehydrogenase